MYAKSTFTIKPLSLGRLNMDKSQFLFGTGFGEKIDIVVIMWYLENSKNKILVDTGCPEPNWCAKYHYPAKRSFEEDPVHALAKIGVDPDDIDIVILTHLHWDHCYNNNLFKNATFFVQREELKYAICPLPVHALAYESITAGMVPPYITTKFEVLNGDVQIIDGVSVIFAPGHTPGMQGVLVNTVSGNYFIAGDNIPLYENWNDNKSDKHIPISNFVNLEDYYSTASRIERIVEGDFILPGHDPKVLEKEVYC